MTNQEFEEKYAEEIKEITATLKLTVKALEILFDELQKSKLPDDIKRMVIQNYKIKGE